MVVVAPPSEEASTTETSDIVAASVDAAVAEIVSEQAAEDAQEALEVAEENQDQIEWLRQELNSRAEALAQDMADLRSSLPNLVSSAVAEAMNSSPQAPMSSEAEVSEVAEAATEILAEAETTNPDAEGVALRVADEQTEVVAVVQNRDRIRMV